MNVRGDDTTLHVHTNGTHSMARFENDGQLGTSKRDEISPADYHFNFPGVQGVKLESQGLHNDRSFGSTEDLTAFAYGLAYGDGLSSPLKVGGDVWTYGVCDKTTHQPTFYGKLIAELFRPDSTYEPVGEPQC